MMDASLPADQSGLSDLSTASIASIGRQYLGPPSPLIGQPLASLPQTPSSAHSNATPDPSRIISASNTDEPGGAWTPSPDASSSRSKSTSRSIHRTSPKNGNGNESMASSLGTFDYSNASFSESFLRQAGAHLLAGLDETELPPPAASSSSSSPRYRTSSSPTVTARPIRTADPRTPFTGKSLRTRMAEAGVMDSPASSDGSSPTSSPTARMLPDSYTRSISFQPEHVDQHSPLPSSHSPRVDRFSTAYSPSLDRVRYASEGSPLQQERSTAGESDWQEGLSMVPEESYVEDASQLPSSPAVEQAASQRSTVLDEHSSASILRNKSVEAVAEASASSLQAPDRSNGSAPSDQTPPTPSDTDLVSPSETSSEAKPALDSDASQSPSRPPSLPASPRSSPATPATPSTAPRTVHTPRSFARLRVGTPVRSSPLSRVVNFSPASSGSATSQWQSPVSQRGSVHAIGSSPASVLEQEASFASTREEHADAAQSTLESSSRREKNGEQPASQPQTPHGSIPAQPADGTPSYLWSPATSASFATPASQRPLPPSAPSTPAFSQPLTAGVAGAYSSPAADFGTPQWSPSPAPFATKIEPVHDTEETKPQPQEIEQEELASSSACSSTSAASERKQSGDVSTSSQPPIESHKKELDVSLVSTKHHFDSPSAARFSRLQLSRVSPPTAVPAQLASVPELSLVASAFDTLGHLSDSRVSRLLAQLSASTARIDELEAALVARETEQAELHDVRHTLAQLSAQYDELVHEADAKDAVVAGLVEKLRMQLEEAGRGREVELEQMVDEERRMREVERRDYEVRIQGLMNGPITTPANQEVRSLEETSDDRMQAAIEQAKEQLRATLEKDFDVRRAMEQRELQARVEQLERELAATTASHPDSEAEADREQDSELQRQVDHLTSELDRRFEELHDLREDVEAVTLQRDCAEEKVQLLEQELDEARTQAHDHTRSSSSNVKINAQLEEELDELRSTLSERDAEVSRLQETLSLTSSRLASLASEHESLVHQHDHLSSLHSETAARTAQLESHILTLETQLRTRTPSKPTEPPAVAGTPAADRVSRLERELASLQLELVKMGKANDALQEDNVHFSIALSAKQLELGMVKRNARFALKNAQAHANAATGGDDVGLPRSKGVAVKEGGVAQGKGEVVWPVVPQGEIVVEVGKENGNGNAEQVPVNQARLHARQMLAQRRAAAGTDGPVTSTRRNRAMMAA
ncbi:conserved hypothetical protein [Sporisorium reilianum SRZ2]|uniref:Uncharacterized protein n=1 Tax=Sporisorium reilianum (strain SRZ2) TaxID=999809 RepID=E6ZV49_SPORE|nr:conserved hypothetical protein [Sporisorium reilianum SRZ2]